MPEMPVVGVSSNCGIFFLCPRCRGDTSGGQQLDQGFKRTGGTNVKEGWDLKQPLSQAGAFTSKCRGELFLPGCQREPLTPAAL